MPEKNASYGTAKEEAAAIKIEAHIRGRKDREKVQKMREDLAQKNARERGEGSKEQYEAAALIQSQRRAALARERVETLKAERAQRDEKERVAEEARIKAAKELQKSGPQPPKCIFDISWS